MMLGVGPSAARGGGTRYGFDKLLCYEWYGGPLLRGTIIVCMTSQATKLLHSERFFKNVNGGK